jgi:hypothetical protein
MPPPLSPEVLAKREQVLRAHYARGDLKALAAELGVSLNRLQSMASQLGIPRDHSLHRGPRSEDGARARALILELSARPAGTTAREVADAAHIERNTVDSIVRRMARQGHLASAANGPREVRYFASRALADAYAASLRKAAATPAASSVRVPPRIGPAHLPGEPLITAHTKFTRAAPPPQQAFRSNTFLMAG